MSVYHSVPMEIKLCVTEPVFYIVEPESHEFKGQRQKSLHFSSLGVRHDMIKLRYTKCQEKKYLKMKTTLLYARIEVKIMMELRILVGYSFPIE